MVFYLHTIELLYRSDVARLAALLLVPLNLHELVPQRKRLLTHEGHRRRGRLRCRSLLALRGVRAPMFELQRMKTHLAATALAPRFGLEVHRLLRLLTAAPALGYHLLPGDLWNTAPLRNTLGEVGKGRL